jgi:hypothetical protein
MEHHGLSANTPVSLYTRRGAIGRPLRAATFPTTPPKPLRRCTCTPRYRLTANPTEAPWSASMATTFRTMLGYDLMGTTTIRLLSGYLAPTTYATTTTLSVTTLPSMPRTA